MPSIPRSRRHCEPASNTPAGLEHARNAGVLLVQAKEQFRHGEWLPWLKANVRFSERTAQAYMRVAKRWKELEAKAQGLADLTFEDGLKLLAEPKEAERTADVVIVRAEPKQQAPKTVAVVVSAAENEEPRTAHFAIKHLTIEDAVRACRPASAEQPVQVYAKAVEKEEPQQSAGEREPGEDDDDEPPEGEDAEGSGELLDQAGQPLPPQAQEAFNQLPELRKLLQLMDHLAKEIERVGKMPVGLHMHWQSARSQIRAAKNTMRGGRPAYVCPYCNGKKKECQACYGNGWVTVTTYENAPAQMKEIQRGKDGAA
jgi:hypothetical protein